MRPGRAGRGAGQRKPKMGDATVVLTPDGSIQHAMVGAVLRWGLLRGPDPDPVPLEGNFLTRGVRAELLVGAGQWAALGSDTNRKVRVVSNRVAEVGSSSIMRETLVASDDDGTPVARVFFTTTHCDAAGTRSLPLPDDVVRGLRAAGAAATGPRTPWRPAPVNLDPLSPLLPTTLTPTAAIRWARSGGE